MKTAEERIKALAESKALAEEDAARLLAAVRRDPASRASAARNPFARYSGEVTSAAGLVVALIGVLVARLGVRFDGALDVHTTASPVPLATAVVDQLVAFPLTALVFWAVARIVARHVRVIDVAGVVGLARAPSVLLAVPLAFLRPAEAGAGMTPALAVVLVFALTAIGVHFYLLFVGLRTASGVTGGRAVATFIAAVVAAEIASKVVLHLALNGAATATH